MDPQGARRPHPFELMFAGARERSFPAVQEVLGETSDVAAFLLAAPALELLRELRPDDGLGEGIDDFVALVHAAFLFWRDGERTITLEEAATDHLCRADDSAEIESTAATGATQYIQVAPHLIWGQLAAGEPFEPLDGWFAVPGDDELRVIACFGVHEHRPGVSVAAVEGRYPGSVAREGGGLLFAPTMPGGDAAHLHSVTAPEELLLLGWRVVAGEEIPQ